MSIALVVLSLHFNDGWALVATVLLSCLASILGIACKWELRRMSLGGARSLRPKSDLVICYPNNTFVIVRCETRVVQALFYSFDQPLYLLPRGAYRIFSLLGAVMLVYGVISLANAKIDMQIAIGAAYLILNVAYWLVAALPERWNWDHGLDIKRLDYIPCRSFISAVWLAIKLTKATRWAREAQIVPSTRAWDEWLVTAKEAACGIDPDSWDPGQALSSISRVYGED